MWCADAHNDACGGQSSDVESLRKPPVRQIAAIEWHVWPPERQGHANVSAIWRLRHSPNPLGMLSLGDTPAGGRLRGDVQLPAGGPDVKNLSGRSTQRRLAAALGAAPNGRASVELAIISSPFHPLP